MSCESKKGQVITTGGILRKPSGENLTLKEALDEIAKCCTGTDCCNRWLNLQDKTTDGFGQLYLDNSVLKLQIGEDIYTVGITLDT